MFPNLRQLKSIYHTTLGSLKLRTLVKNIFECCFNCLIIIIFIPAGIPLSTEGVESLFGMRRHISSWCFRSSQAELCQSENTVLRQVCLIGQEDSSSPYNMYYRLCKFYLNSLVNCVCVIKQTMLCNLLGSS